MFPSVSADRSRKRRTRDRMFGITTFGDPGCPGDFDGSFRENMKVFLEECAEPELYPVEGFPAWSVTLQESDTNGDRCSLLIIEEASMHSLHPHCDHCRCIGWSHHPVSNKRWHLIIPAPEFEERPIPTWSQFGVGGKVCPQCSDPVPSTLFSCPSCGEEAVPASMLDLQSHLLHGVLHSNGFGHLLRVNGREKGSKLASGRELMDLWDRLCAMLRARKVSVEDVARKRSLEFRLLHAVAYGECWYGRWGYKFGHGSFGISQQMYVKAIEAIRGMPLSVMCPHFEGVDQDVLAIVAMYQRISCQNLQTVGDLIRFMMELKARLPLHPTSKTFSKNSKDFEKKSSSSCGTAGTTSPAVDMPCRWSVKRLELATQVIVESLKNCEKKWMPRQDVRDAARVYIGDTGLLDFVLKSLGNRVVGGHVVRRAVNPMTKVLEYSLEDVSGSATILNKRERGQPEPVCEVGRGEVLRDIVYIYKHVLENYKPARRGIKSILTAIPTASRIILDTKQFIKDYRGEITRKCANNEWDMDDDENLRVMCTVILKDEVAMRNRPSPPAELVVLPPHATIGDLKAEAQRAFRETYHIFQNFFVESIPHLDGDDEDLLFGTIESGSTVVVEGSGIDMRSDWRYEGGNDTWIVDCPCGTKDDDGERMIACDVCEVWQHTRCGGISDFDAVPLRFLCHRCGVNLFHAML
ncbi:hypothetical protein R1flu_004301 [Riccia fluitans]|uniref:Zinc finger PHD-type domain-containing protein n=1 Tax=Riccia fluitans TaxID=41844 RepID=A0ABD1YPW9_9MARC